MLKVLINNWYRLKENKGHMILSISLTVIAIICAVVLTNIIKPKVNIAVVGKQPVITQNSNLKITEFKKAPAKSELVMGRYDAVVTFDNDGKYKIDTVKSDKLKSRLENMLDGKDISSSDTNERGVGANIIGYMMMFILMQGMLYVRTFSEDKEKHQIERIFCSPISFMSYLSGHLLFGFLFTFVPTLCIILLMYLFNISIGFALWQYVVLIAVMSLISTCIPVFFYSLCKKEDTANMAGNSIIVLCTMLAGSFVSVGNKGSLFSKILYIIPQKDFMNFVEKWEHNSVNTNTLINIIYVIAFSLLLLFIGVIKTRKDYIYHK